MEYSGIDELVYLTDFVNGTTLRSPGCLSLLITVENGDIWMSAARVTDRDLFALNGAFHIVDE